MLIKEYIKKILWRRTSWSIRFVMSLSLGFLLYNSFSLEINAAEVADLANLANLEILIDEPPINEFISVDSVAYFCNKEGFTLEYTRKKADGSIYWYDYWRIYKVEKNAVTYSIEILNKNKKPKIKETSLLTAVISHKSVNDNYSAGVYIDTGSSMAAIMQAYTSDYIKFTSKGEKSLLPSDMQVGDSLVPIYTEVYAMGLTMKISINDRIVLRRERIHTEIGDFNCMVVREHKIEKGMGRNRKTIGYTWYARGYGMIRHDTYNMNNERITMELLSSVKKNL
ncbi:MAG: hypothetical protein WC140_04315 [Bacteroidales bacterium]